MINGNGTWYAGIHTYICVGKIRKYSMQQSNHFDNFCHGLKCMEKICISVLDLDTCCK